MTTEQARDIGPGDVVVLRGLRANPKNHHSAPVGPKIGLVAKMLPRGRIFVRLRMGGLSTSSMRFSKKGRICDVACVDRIATKRETVLGDVIVGESAVAA